MRRLKKIAIIVAGVLAVLVPDFPTPPGSDETHGTNGTHGTPVFHCPLSTAPPPSLPLPNHLWARPTPRLLTLIAAWGSMAA